MLIDLSNDPAVGITKSVTISIISLGLQVIILFSVLCVQNKVYIFIFFLAIFFSYVLLCYHNTILYLFNNDNVKMRKQMGDSAEVRRKKSYKKILKFYCNCKIVYMYMYYRNYILFCNS